MSTAPNGQSGNPTEQAPLYAFYDKTKEKQKGLVWAHRELLEGDLVTKFLRDQLLSKFGRDTPKGKGYVRLPDWCVAYQFLDGGKDEKNREHWTLLMAWFPNMVELGDLLSVFDDDVFKHVASKGVGLPKVLPKFEYEPKFSQLAFEGSRIEEEISHENARRISEGIMERGEVDIVFYHESLGQDGKSESVMIETRKKLSK